VLHLDLLRDAHNDEMKGLKEANTITYTIMSKDTKLSDFALDQMLTTLTSALSSRARGTRLL
jgi:hypothetical protein